MKKYLSLFFIISYIILNAQTELVRWTKNDLSATNVSNTASQNITAAGVTVSPTTWSDTFFMISGLTSSSTIDTGKYVQFTISPNANYKLTLSNLNLKYRNQGGSSKLEIRYSTNSDFSNPQTLVSNATSNTDWISLSQSLSNLAIPSGKSLYIRLYVYQTYNNFHLSYTTNGGTGTGPNITGTVAVDTPAVPVANNDSYTSYKNSDANFDILSNDVSSTNFTLITITQQPAHGTVTPNGTTNVTYKPTADYEGSDSFKYKVSNSTGASNEATVNINVTTAVPVANNDSYTAYKNNYSNFNVLSNDTSVLAINSITVTQQPAHGTLTVNGTTNVTYKPESGYIGADSFKYKAGNVTGLSNEATASINIVENTNTVLARWNNSNFSASIYNTQVTAMDGNNGNGNITSTSNLSYVQYIDLAGYNAFHTTGWPDKNTQTIDRSKYIQFTISPKNGYKLNLSEFKFICRTDGSDANIKIDYSLNSNFSTFFNILPETTVNNSISTISLTNFSKPIATDGQIVYIRVYVYNTWNAFQILLNDGGANGPAFSGYTEFSSTAPIAYNDTVTNIVNNDIDVNVLINDDYSNKITSITHTQPSHGFASLNADRTINYIPTKDYVGADSFTYYITNEYGVSNAATVSISNNLNATTPLIRWDQNNFSATPFQSFINTTPMTTTGGITLNVGGETNPKAYYLVSQSNGTGGTVNTSKYTRVVLDNSSTNKTIEPKTFSYVAKGTDGAIYELRYSKKADFSDYTVMATGTVTGNYTLKTFNFTNTLKIEPTEKVYVRLYLYNTDYVQYVFQYLPGGSGPEIDGIFYNYVYATNDTIWLNPAYPHWSNGTPTATKNAIVETIYDTTTYGNFESQNLTIRTGGTLTVNPGGYITVNGQIANNNTAAGSFIVENNGNLMQNGPSQNTGTITVKKEAIIPKMGYNYWSSPVAGQNLYQFSEGYNQANGGNGTGTPWNRFYLYNEATDYFVTSITAENIALNSSSTFLPARGYAIRGKNSFPENVTITTTPAEFQFVGTPQNGDINSYNLRWSGATKGYNMVGNPYPSNISFDDFYEHNKTKMNGTAYFWTNNDEKITSQQSTSYSGNNYAILNSTGGASATYFGYNNRKPNGNIAVGQGFIIQAKEAGKGQPLNFTNAMRTPDIANYYNKGAQKNRFWLEFKSPTDVNNEILIGYINNATNAYDVDYDADLLAIGSDSFWSILDSHKLAIQSKNPTFSVDDITKIGFKAAVSGNYTISLTDRDGIFGGTQSVYLKDKYLNKVVNVTNGSYVFYTNSGQYEDRFEIVYISSVTLGTNDNTLKGIIVTKDNQNFIVRSDDNISDVSLYDLAGRLLFNTKNAKKDVRIDKTSLAEGMYIIKASSGNTVVTKKVLK